jgi:hypothetical protein
MVGPGMQPRHVLGKDRHEMVLNPTYLREQAHRCVRLARECPHLPTAQELEAIGIEFMEKAAELDDLLAVRQ